MKIKVVNVGIKIDRIITVKLVFEKKLLNVINAYEPQVKCNEKKK
jgi:hypothetical protein